LAIALSAERAVQGRFGPYGGRYVPETLVAALDDLTALYDAVRNDPGFWEQFESLLAEFVGRPSPMSEAPRLSEVVGPDPYPRMVRDFQSIIGREARGQILARCGRLPHTVVACVGGGSNAIGIFAGFLDDPTVELVGVEAAGEGLESGHHSATLSAGIPGVLHGSLSYLLQDADGQVAAAHSVSAGLDYPGVGPEHSYLRDSGRVRYESATDAEALDAFQELCRLEGIIPALEPAHALAWVRRSAGRWPPRAPVLVCLSGRGDKDVAHVADLLRHPV
jgi:tryptophan synthase beta chain